MNLRWSSSPTPPPDILLSYPIQYDVVTEPETGMPYTPGKTCQKCISAVLPPYLSVKKNSLHRENRHNFLLPLTFKESGTGYVAGIATCCRSTVLLPQEVALFIIKPHQLIWKKNQNKTKRHQTVYRVTLHLQNSLELGWSHHNFCLL